MNIKKEEIEKQIEKLKELISQNVPKQEIKTEQKKLNQMLEQYLNTNKK